MSRSIGKTAGGKNGGRLIKKSSPTEEGLANGQMPRPMESGSQGKGIGCPLKKEEERELLGSRRKSFLGSEKGEGKSSIAAGTSISKKFHISRGRGVKVEAEWGGTAWVDKGRQGWRCRDCHSQRGKGLWNCPRTAQGKTCILGPLV